MAQMRTYRSKESVKARKVTAKEGETVTTTNGPAFAAKGDYVVEKDGNVEVRNGEAFEKQFKAPAKRSAAKKSPAKKTTSRRR